MKEMEQGNMMQNEFTVFFDMLKGKIKNYVVIFVVSLALGMIVAYSIPKTYMSQIMLAPETSTENTLGGNLSSLSSLAGINLNGMNSDAFFPEIYPEVIRATDFLVELSTMKVCSADKKINTTLYDYMKNLQKSPWWYYPLRIFNSGKSASTENEKLNYYHLTPEQSGVISSIENSISCSVDQKTGVITIKAFAQDPDISAALADSVSRKLKVFITNYRTNKARNDLANIQLLYEKAKMKYEKARQNYSYYADTNQELVLQSYKSKETDLENEMQLQYNIYTQLTTQLQMAKAKVIEKTPVFATLQPAVVPYKKNGPKRSLIILAFLFVGCMGYTAYLMFNAKIKGN